MIKIIDYKAGNAPSVLAAVERLGYKASFARTAAGLDGATRIILPGVGSAGATMGSLREAELIDVLEKAVLTNKTPFLGICVGLQVLFEESEEDNAKCLGWLKGKVIKFEQDKVRVPQMGWNRVSFVKGTDKNNDYYYFVNSYYAVPYDAHEVWGMANYDGINFTAAVNRGNIYATQFHIEKSGEAGLKLLEKFLD